MIKFSLKFNMEHGLIREGTTLLTWRQSYEGHPIHDLFQTPARLMISKYRTVLVNGEITIDTNDPYKFYVALLGYDHLQECF